MHFNVKQFYTPCLETYELNEQALIVDTETVGTGPTVEIIEIAFGDTNGRIIYESLVHPIFNPLRAAWKHQRFDEAELANAPYWTEIWPTIASLTEGRLLVAYNAAFDRRALAATCSRYHQTTNERGWRCAMQLVKRTAGTIRSLPLADACAHYGLEGGNHRAGRDVQATCELLKALTAAAGENATPSGLPGPLHGADAGSVPS